MSALWGAPYLLIKVAVHELSPALIVSARTAIGAAALLPWAARSGALHGLRARWRLLVGLALVQMAAPFTLITIGERHIASSLAGILVASAPLFVAVLAIWIAPDERPHGLGAIGLMVGFGGVVVLLGIETPGTTAALIGAGEIVLASFSYAIAGHLLKARFADAQPLGVVSVTTSVSALVLLAPAATSLPSHAPSLKAVLSVIGLGVGCTGLAFVLFVRLNLEIGPGRASLVAYVAPLFAVILGVVLLAEPVRVTTVAGMALILLGSWLTVARHRGSRVLHQRGLARRRT